MKILVCISHVPDTTTKINFSSDNKSFDSTAVQFVINPYDEIALTRALEVAEQNGGTVTVINVGEVSTEPTLRKALAIGANDAIRIDAAPRDAYYVARQIAKVAGEGSYDFILTGRESIDFNGAQVTAMIGELLSIASVSLCKKLEVKDRKAILNQEIEGGTQVISVSFPFIASASEGMAEPRIPNMRGIMSARTKPLVVQQAIDIPVLTRVATFDKPKPRGEVTLIDAATPEKLIDLLHTEAKVI